MRVHPSLAAAFLFTALVSGHASVMAQSSPARAWVLDSEAQTISAVDISTGRSLLSTGLQGAPTVLLRTPNGRRLLALDRGEGDSFGDDGFRARTRSTVTIIEAATLKVQARVELGTGLMDAVMLAADGERLSVVCPGYRTKKAADRRPRELVTVDLGAGTVLSRVELTRPAPEVLATPDGRTVVVLSRREAGKTPRQAEFTVIEAATGTIQATVPLDGDPRGPVLAPGGQFVHALDRGKPNNNPEKNQNGRLHTLSIASRTVVVSDAGSNPRGLVLDEERRQLLLLSDGAPVRGPENRERHGELRVLRGGQPSAPIAVVRSPERIVLGGDGRSYYVLGAPGAMRLALPDLTATPLIAAPGLGGAEVAISADGRRGWMSSGEYFTTFDLERGGKLAEIKSGRLGKKMFLALGAGLATESSRLNSRNEARSEGRSYYEYTEYSVKPARNTIAVRPDGREVYVLNSQTSDVTIVAAESGEVLEKVAAGGFDVLFFPAVGAAIIPSDSQVHVVDLVTRTKRPSLVADSDAAFERAALSPDARQAVIHGPRGILFVNTSSGEPVSMLVKGRAIADVVIDWGR